MEHETPVTRSHPWPLEASWLFLRFLLYQISLTPVGRHFRTQVERPVAGRSRLLLFDYGCSPAHLKLADHASSFLISVLCCETNPHAFFCAVDIHFLDDNQPGKPSSVVPVNCCHVMTWLATWWIADVLCVPWKCKGNKQRPTTTNQMMMKYKNVAACLTDNNFSSYFFPQVSPAWLVLVREQVNGRCA